MPSMSDLRKAHSIIPAKCVKTEDAAVDLPFLSLWNGGMLSRIYHLAALKALFGHFCAAVFQDTLWRQHELLSSMCVINLRLNKTSLRIMKPSVMTV